ncbi:MAG: NADH-quinone oxidoreductase subunit L [Pseudomonadota bacterium]
MEPLLVLLPLFGALLAMPVGRSFGPRAAELTTTLIMALAAIWSWVIFIDVMTNHTVKTEPLFTWFASGDFQASWAMRIDTLSAVMLVVVNTVSTLVHAYSIGYMHDDPHRPRFFAYLSLFTFAMLALVTADNFMQLFFGWEGVGLASYLLIGFWFKKPSANAAAIKAFVVNRVGDFGFALGIMGIFWVFRSVEFDTVFSIIANNGDVVPYGLSEGGAIQTLKLTFFGIEAHALTAIAVLLFIGAMGKSAQFLLHTWLPDAMEGPTPVSALIHAATMVTAGVFLVCRCSIIYEYAPSATALITLVGATTAFFAASVGLLQDDIKKVIAYSTCSQLGYMFFAAGVGAYGAAMFHLFTHAFFKALLFLGAGAVIHGMHHEQDMKKMGGVRHLMPMTHLLMVIGTVAITGVGVPFVYLFGAPLGTAGFVSKDVVIESAFAAAEAGAPFAMYAFVMSLIAAVFTAFYSWRLIFLTFWGKSRASEEVRKHFHPPPNWMMAPLVPLAVGALVAGMAFYGNFVGKSADKFWNGSLYAAVDSHGEGAHGETSHSETPYSEGGNASPATESSHSDGVRGDGVHGDGDHAGALPSSDTQVTDDHASDGQGGAHHAPGWVILSPFIAMLIGTGAAFFHYMRGGNPLRAGVIGEGGMIYAFLKNKWYFDEIYTFLLVKPAYALGRILWKTGDGKTIDGLGPDGIAAAVTEGAKRIVRIQTGYMYHYAFVMLIGIAVFLSYVLLTIGGGS